MTNLQIKNKFQKELSGLYPKEEISSFFYLLAEEYLQIRRVDIALDPDKKVSEQDQNKFLSALSRLMEEEPVQYIIGVSYFYDLPFKVNNKVLIPRPETEQLVDWIIKISKTKNEKVKILDIGTGSGCIAVSLAKNLPETEVWALDISENAISIAKENAKINQTDIHFIKTDILTTKNIVERFDVIVSNPPYVRELEKEKMKNNVLKFEPELALFVEDEDPLLFYKKIADFAKDHLIAGGELFFEINQYQAENTLKMLKNKGFQNIELRKDIFGNDRMIRAVYSTSAKGIAD